MRNDLLHVVTCVSNPIRWQSRIALYKAFEQHMLASGVKLTTVECAFGERPFELDNRYVNHVKVRANAGALVWNKEPLLNIGIARLPADAKYIATIDADVAFRNADWAAETVHALQHYPVVQPWSDCYDLGPNGVHLELHRSFCRLAYEGKPIMQGPGTQGGPYQFGHPGYAWAWTRQALEWAGGLIETAGLGAADHHMATALIGRVGDSIPEALGEAYRAPLHIWQARVGTHIARNISYVPGTIEHTFHGAKGKRAYVDRWKILIENNFDPVIDLKRNTYGVIELAGNKPQLRHDIDRYFRSRNEDANTQD
jgi:hypothetical protein